MKNSKIEWTDHTFNPWRGCTKVSPGCANCYAEAMSGRNPAVLGSWGPKGSRVIASESMWRQPVKWNLEARSERVRRRVFCASLADVFGGPETMPAGEYRGVKAARARLLDLIADTPWLDWLLLTKRPENIMPSLREICGALDIDGASDYLAEKWIAGEAPSNVWIGTSMEDQAAADRRIPELLRIPARVRFLSMEPLLGPVDLAGLAFWTDQDGQIVGVEDRDPESFPHIHWVIVGGESGPRARPMHPDWARSIRDQCQQASVPFFFKQWGEWAPGSAFRNDAIVMLDDGRTFLQNDIEGMRAADRNPPFSKLSPKMMHRAGKQAAGREFDGRTWDEVPG